MSSGNGNLRESLRDYIDSAERPPGFVPEALARIAVRRRRVRQGELAAASVVVALGAAFVVATTAGGAGSGGEVVERTSIRGCQATLPQPDLGGTQLGLELLKLPGSPRAGQSRCGPG